MQDAIDFSRLERIKPREDSWNKICSRLNSIQGDANKTNAFPFYTLIPLAASFVLVGLSILVTALHNLDSVPESIDETAYSEISTWYNSLGNETSDDLETLDEAQTISYLLKE